MAFLDDLHVVSVPARIASVEQQVEVQLWRHSRIEVNQGKTQVWNRSGETLLDCDHIFRGADGEMNDAWRGDLNLPTHAQGIKLLGIPLGHADFVQKKLAEKIDEHRVLLHWIPQVSDLQCS